MKTWHWILIAIVVIIGIIVYNADSIGWSSYGEYLQTLV